MMWRSRSACRETRLGQCESDPSEPRCDADPVDCARGVTACGMRWISGGTFLMGSEDFYPEERPLHRVEVDGFWMDEAPVTAGEFRRFVRATGYVTVAERPLDPKLYPDPDLLVPGSLPDACPRRTQGRVSSLAELASRRARGHVAGQELRAQRLRPLRRVRECLGVDERLVHAAAPRRGRVAVLRTPQSPRELRGGELRGK